MENSFAEQHAQDQALLDANSDRSASIIDLHAKDKNKKLLFSGQRWICIGMMLMGVSFLLNFALMGADLSIHIPMYILTCLGTCAIVKGLANVFGG